MALAFAMTIQRLALFTSIQVLNWLLVNYCVLGFCLVACLFGCKYVDLNLKTTLIFNRYQYYTAEELLHRSNYSFGSNIFFKLFLSKV